jgi:hypothetical protein
MGGSHHSNASCAAGAAETTDSMWVSERLYLTH